MHHDFPKMIWPEGKSRDHAGVIVHSLDEEERLLGVTPAASFVEHEVARPEPEAEDGASDMKNALMKAAAQARGKRK